MNHTKQKKEFNPHDIVGQHPVGPAKTSEGISVVLITQRPQAAKLIIQFPKGSHWKAKHTRFL
jgi:hypothetical protein